MEPLSAFVLAGGKSTRMGADKALLDLGGAPLIIRALALAGTVTDRVTIVGDPAKFSRYGRTIADVYPDRGPLGGIHAALSSSEADWNLLLAVDLPFLQPAFLKYLFAEAQSSNAVAIVPFADGHWHPLCAIYKREFGEYASGSLSLGHNKVDPLFSEVSTRVIAEQELAALGFQSSMFRNLNTPADWDRAKLELA